MTYLFLIVLLVLILLFMLYPNIVVVLQRCCKLDSGIRYWKDPKDHLACTLLFHFCFAQLFLILHLVRIFEIVTLQNNLKRRAREKKRYRLVWLSREKIILAYVKPNLLFMSLLLYESFLSACITYHCMSLHHESFYARQCQRTFNC